MQKTYGTGGTQVNILLGKLEKIEGFAKNKGKELYSSSKKLKEALGLQLILLVTTILLMSLIINYILLHNIRKPLNVLTDATKRFHDGDIDARSSYELQNEFGVLSSSFNSMAESIQVKMDLDHKVASLSSLILSEYDARKFFQATINALSVHTGSQMAAIYLLSEDKQSYQHFESIGVGDNARKSFDANNFEGEFGPALASHKVQHISNISENTRFVFNTVSGKFIPQEIITLPIIANNQVVAIISLASMGAYSTQAIQLINRVLVTLCARVEGILAYHHIKKISEKLEIQNRELEAQKTELASQSAELTEQNTELEMQKKQLNEANQHKTNFLSNMSHELRTPLNSVIALSGVLSRRLVKKIETEEYSYLEIIERNGRHLLSLINDILDISRIEAGKEELEITNFNINNLISDVTGSVLPLAQQKNISLIHSDSNGSLFVSSDADKCRHILQNLIGNAVKFTEKGKIEVHAHQNNERILISVKDTGIGISENNLNVIFDEFRQADGGTSRKFGGTGLGLAIANKYANLIGGEIKVKSILGEGSEFILIIPSKYADENRIVKTDTITGFNHSIRHTPEIQYSERSLKTILLVEDSEPAIIQIKDFLEESGYKILVARRDGNEALGIISQTIPDAIILDLMMPVTDWF